MLSTRRVRHDLASAALAARSDDELAALLQTAPASAAAWAVVRRCSSAPLARATGPPAVASEHSDIEAVVAQFGGDPAVQARFEALAGAESSLVLFLEYLPEPLLNRLKDPLGMAETFERQLFEAVEFLRRREVLHMDGHFGNMRADVDQIYLVDFGLATSLRFDLSDVEREFSLGMPSLRLK